MPDLTAEAELAVLGCVLATSGQCIDDIHLTGDDFYEPKHGDLYDLMVRLHQAGKPVEAFTLAEANPKRADFLFELTSGYHVPSSVGYYADIVSKHALVRRLSSVAAKLTVDLEDMDATQVADHARGLIDAAIGLTSQPVQYVRDILPMLEARIQSGEQFIPSPWKSLNEKIGGFRPGAVYVIAARPGIGKTVVAAQIAAELAKRGHVAFSSLEMSGEELVARIVAEQLRINVRAVKDADMSSTDWDKYRAGREQLEALNIAIDDRAAVGAGEVRGFARAVSRKGELAGVVVDYMQLMSSKSKADRHVQVAEFSRQLKILAKDFKIPVIALSQLNRNADASSLAVPKLSDLRESGAIEQDADVVILLRREGDFPSESLLMDVAKNRHGKTGDFSLSWDGGYQRAVEWDAPGDWN